MDRRLACLLFLYPRQFRSRYGAEIASLTEQLVRDDDGSRFWLYASLAAQGLNCRMRSASARTAAAMALTATIGCGAFADLSIATAKPAHPSPQTVQRRHLATEDRVTPGRRAGHAKQPKRETHNARYHTR